MTCYQNILLVILVALMMALTATQTALYFELAKCQKRCMALAAESWRVMQLGSQHGREMFMASKKTKKRRIESNRVNKATTYRALDEHKSLRMDPTHSGPVFHCSDSKNMASMWVRNDRGDSRSACVLVLDEPTELSEWLEYQYSVGHLQYLLIAVHPRAAAATQRILDPLKKFIKVEQWTEADYVVKGTNVKHNMRLGRKHRSDLMHQGAFFDSCTKLLSDYNGFSSSLPAGDEKIVRGDVALVQ